MPYVNIKTTHKPIKTYYDELDNYTQLGAKNEGTVRSAFQNLLQHYCGKCNLTLLCERTKYIAENRRITPDGEVVDSYGIPHGYWEAKDTQDDLHTEATKKFAAGYPSKNIVLQSPTHALLYQHDELVHDLNLTDPKNLVQVLESFFAYQAENISAWHTAVAEFKEMVPELGNKLKELIENERQNNSHFHDAFSKFHQQCQASINPNLSIPAVEEMLIQHLLTERLFRTVFDNPDFTRRNIIAREIENVIDVLTERSLNRSEFLRPLERFYTTIEKTANTITDFSQKQSFLNTVYEQFFQGFSVKVADTHGIVYTPQPIVDFMVKSVEHILQTEFGRSIADEGVHIIDPFVGTGNFIVRIMQELDPIALERKYTANPPELQCNEVMLLPYYIANMNIEQQFYTKTNRYASYEGLCLVDTFELAEDKQIPLLAPANTQRVEKQKQTPMFVVIGNPPYNVGQVNENDNNKNRKYETMDKRVAETYVKDSKATLRNKLSDPYVKAIRWASDRIGKEGIVAFVTNNGFLDGIAFDGMRKHLAQDFNIIYHIDFKGNARTSGERRRQEGGNIFDDQIRVGIGISFFIKKGNSTSKSTKVFIHTVDEYLKANEKQSLLTQFTDISAVSFNKIKIDEKYTWLTEGLHSEFYDYIPIGIKSSKNNKEPKSTIFNIYSLGVATNRDYLAYSYNLSLLEDKVKTFIEIYNTSLDRRKRQDKKHSIDDSIDTNDPRIKWTRQVKRSLNKMESNNFEVTHIRRALYRPFNRQYLYFDNFWNEERYQQYRIYPTKDTELENMAICVSGIGGKKPFQTLAVGMIPDLHFTGDSQCFPFYTYDEDGSNRRENITDWALNAFQTQYKDNSITKWDIFHYNYGLLHHPEYREKYQANLKRDLPHIPFVKDFWGFTKAGARLAEIHVNYESQPEYEYVILIQNPDVPLNWRVEKMKLSKDKTSLVYNNFLTIDGIPLKALDYRLGTRSALEWIINQYCVKTDKRSGIVNDPNREDDPQYIVRLIRQVITISLETVDIVEELPKLDILNIE
ncbi:DNA helicase [Candidatus Poribacteria bacterium]|nr:MAG: DNA helicase [Candidatus Poribacteria bacterium]